MVKKQIKVGDIPAILYGQSSEGVYLYVHGQHSCKEAAESFAEVVNGKGWQVLAMDLPEHGERKSEENAFYAWNVVPELRVLLKYARERWGHVSLRANSIGAYFSMMSYQGEHFENVQLVSPILDMQKLCEDMMNWAGVSSAELEEKKFIKTDFGQTLCWQEYCYAKDYPVKIWNSGTVILYGSEDNLTTLDTVKSFCERFRCGLTIMKDGEHWFHTPEQLGVLRTWTEKVMPELPHRTNMINYRFATIDDIDLLVSQRLRFIEVKDDGESYDFIKDNCYLYFQKSLANDSCDVVLAERNGVVVGTGTVFYYDSVPSGFNPRGKNAYVTSLYVEPEYRNRGIAKAILTEITSKSVARGYEIIMLNASDMGKNLYKKMGFTDIHNGMILDMRGGRE